MENSPLIWPQKAQVHLQIRVVILDQQLPNRPDQLCYKLKSQLMLQIQINSNPLAPCPVQNKIVSKTKDQFSLNDKMQ